MIELIKSTPRIPQVVIVDTKEEIFDILKINISESTKEYISSLLQEEGIYILFQGRSIPESSVDVYSSFLSEIQELFNQKKSVNLLFYLEYLNTFTMKFLATLLNKSCKEYRNIGGTVHAFWLHDENDEDSMFTYDDLKAVCEVMKDAIPLSLNEVEPKTSEEILI